MATGSPRDLSGARTIDLAPTVAFLLDVPEPQSSQGRVLTEALRYGYEMSSVSLIGLTDYHGQLEQTTTAYDTLTASVGGAAQLATMFDEQVAALPDGSVLLVTSGDNVGASPANSGLLEDKPAIDVLNAIGIQATTYGNHEFDYGLDRLANHRARATFKFLVTNIIETATGLPPAWAIPSMVFEIDASKSALSVQRWKQRLSWFLLALPQG